MKNVDGTTVICNKIDGITVISNFVRPPTQYALVNQRIPHVFHSNFDRSC